MSKSPRSVSSPLFIRGSLVVLLGSLLLARIAYGHMQMQPKEAVKGAILEGALHVHPLQPLAGDQKDKIQPGTSIKIRAIVENKGEHPSPVGQLYVRYAFAPPLHQEKGSVLFETEKKALTEIPAGKKVELTFEASHTLPTLFDFVREDWPIREYQAIALFDQKEYMIGTLAITCSAYYYPAIGRELPAKL